MKTYFWLAGALLFVTLGVTAVTVVTAYSEYTYHHPSGQRVVISDKGGPVPEKEMRRQQTLQEAKEKGLLPRVLADQREYDFGVMNPLTMGSHTFHVRNEGDGPLHLRKGGTTCKCTLSNVTNNLVQPGETAEVTLAWNTGRHTSYSHGATILTNDPENTRLEFRVHGAVRTRVGSAHKSLLFAGLEPDTRGVAETVVYTQMWNDLPLGEVTCTLEGATWEIEPAGERLLTPLEATAGYIVRLHTPDDLPSGMFQGVLRMNFDIAEQDRVLGDAAKVTAENETAESEIAENETAESENAENQIAEQAGAEADEGETFELLFSGNVIRRLSVYGDEIDAAGRVDFNVVTEGRGRKLRLLMKVRDKERELSVKRVDVRPEFVKATVTPFGGEDRRGLYYLDLEVPEDAPTCHHLDPRKQGELKIEFDHPRIEQLVLKLRLAVLPGGI
ncbi:MAG: DUF1573 domain-containing protein [Pirellulaceae bacterium]